eukprot:1161299-Pelagomonas_calceolata.AAC.10
MHAQLTDLAHADLAHAGVEKLLYEPNPCVGISEHTNTTTPTLSGPGNPRQPASCPPPHSASAQ